MGTVVVYCTMEKGGNTMAKRALYREYRPIRFSEVIGQDHITTILKNQVREQQFSHAYLFCGSRGTGKTTTAKILSRAINCLSPHSGEPCETCAACLCSKSGVDILEIDAASNTGVDNVRGLIEQAQFAPLELKHRVFIIDEVHMLSNSAFNALLKTLEEPPPHVVFILATTEPQKLPATVISRCQRFDFHRLTIAHIVSNLQSVLGKVGATIEPDGLRLIARAANGGMRDALSLTDQCLSFCGSHLTAKDVSDVLGSVGQEELSALCKRLFSGDAKGCLVMLNDVVQSGRDLGVFLSDLCQYLRDLLLAKSCSNGMDILDCTEDQWDMLCRVAKNVGETELLYALEQLLKAQGAMKQLPAPRLLLESTLIRICHPVDDNSVEALMARVEKLERSGVKLASEEPNEPAFVQPKRPVTAPMDAPTEQDAPPPLEAPPLEAPPWEEVPVKAPQKRSEPTEPPITKPAPRKTEASDAPQALWEQVKLEIGRRNPMVLFAAKAAHGVSLTESVLTVEFLATDKNFGMFTAPKQLAVAQEALQAIRPEISLHVVQANPTEDEARLKELFGSALTIE